MSPKARTSGKGGPAPVGFELTSGELAGLLRVDLKTIHNWVNRGHLLGRRTSGRHLRFDRVQVVRFMRSYGYPVPDSLTAVPLSAVVDSSRGASWAPVRVLRRDAQVTVCQSLFEAALAVARGDQELLVLDLDQRGLDQVGPFVAAVRRSPEASSLWVLGIGKNRVARQRFLGLGGDAALATGQERDVRSLARWAIGAEAECPAKAELASAVAGA